eukprot:c882_g1_i1.p1 GENE.c882_g1_i1~~c882_g1_i1.p1  ORF type:complete len:298 (+),score=68.32 c882_g1_i1:65-895(+)
MDVLSSFSKEDVLALREYVAAGQEVIGDAPEGMVRLEITHSVLGGLGAGKSTNMFKNFPLDATIFEIKEIAHLHVGTSPEYMKLTLRDRAGNDKAMLLEDSLKLGFFAPKTGWILHIEDRDPMRTVAKYQDLSNLREEDKFKYTDEMYDKREGTLRQWLKNNPQAAANLRTQNGVRDAEAGKELVDKMKLGDRCKVTMVEGGTELGTIRWLGKLQNRQGYFVGVHLDLPQGRNNGSVQGTRYFECDDKYGLFIIPENVEVGDFPEEDLFASDDDKN